MSVNIVRVLLLDVNSGYRYYYHTAEGLPWIYLPTWAGQFDFERLGNVTEDGCPVYVRFQVDEPMHSTRSV